VVTAFGGQLLHLVRSRAAVDQTIGFGRAFTITLLETIMHHDRYPIITGYPTSLAVQCVLSSVAMGVSSDDTPFGDKLPTLWLWLSIYR
jgi:hypothetical protein